LSYRNTKSGLTQIFFAGKQVATVSREDSKNFIAKLNVTDDAGAQLLMAKITGHFKHGTERVSRSKIRNRAGQ
jgi:cell shape-determining protein MreC